MEQLRKQLTLAAIASWGIWLLAIGAGLVYRQPGTTGISFIEFLLSGVAYVLQWLGLAFAVGAIGTHVLIVRDSEMYGPADAADEIVVDLDD